MHALYCPMGNVNPSNYERRLKEDSHLIGITLRHGICYSLSEFKDNAFRHLMGNLDANCHDSWNAYQFIDELKIAAEHQAEEKNRCLGSVKKEMGTEIIDEIVFGKQTHMSAYYLNQLGKIVYGEYCFDSMFYNTDEYDSIVDDKLIDKVKESPDDWAMVFFDYHY